MPYNKAEGSKSITVQKVTITFSVSPSHPWTAGQRITFKVVVTADGSPVPDQTVAFFFRHPPELIDNVVASGRTGADGACTITWTVPTTSWGYTLPCASWDWGAYIGGPIVRGYSNIITGKVAYNTRISIIAADRVVAGEAFTIHGTLEYESSSGVWSPLAGKTVSLFYNTTKIADVTTGSDGSYSASAIIPTGGTYTLKASYAGEGFGFVPAFAILGLPVGVPAEVEPIIPYVTYAFATLPVLAVAGTVAYNELKKRR
jgi:hypothetical protein